MTTKQELHDAAFKLGQMMAEVGDSYDVAESLAAGYAAGMVDQQPTPLLAQLTALNELSSAAREVIRWRVDDARAEFVSWEKIGGALDMTRQAAHERFSK